MGTISDWLHFKVNMKEKFIYLLTLLPKDVQTKYLKFSFLIEFFFHLPTTPVVHLELRREYLKIWNGPYGVLRGFGETDSWKKHEVENLVALSLEVFNVRSLKVTISAGGGGGGELECRKNKNKFY